MAELMFCYVLLTSEDVASRLPSFGRLLLGGLLVVCYMLLGCCHVLLGFCYAFVMFRYFFAILCSAFAMLCYVLLWFPRF